MNDFLKDLKIEFEPTSKLMPYVNNANIHTEEQVEQIANSIKEFGFNDPVAVWTNENGESEIIEGHGRVLAAKKLGLDSLPVIHLDGLSDEARRAYTHVHNQLTRNSEFDFDTLDEELANLNFDWNELGFDVEDFSYIAEELEEQLEVEKEQKADVPFTDYIDEEKNYVVLKFDNKKDWLYASSVLELETVKSLPTRKDGVENEKFRFKGIGRVLDGINAMKKIVAASKGLE